VVAAAHAAAAEPQPAASCAAPAGETIFRVGGPTPTHASFAAAVGAANAMAGAARVTICLAAGTYVDDFAQLDHPARIVGVGGLAHLKAVAPPPNGKAILVTRADAEIENVAFSGASVPDRNGAGIRWEGGDLTLRGAQFFDNENGVLSAGGVSGTLTVEDSRFLRNGFGDGRSHGIYVTSTTAEVLVERSYFEAQRTGHHLKSRAASTTVRDSTFEDGAGGPDDVPSYSIDLPYRGIGVIEGNAFIQRDAQGDPGAVNKYIVNYGGEADAAGADSLILADNTFVNERHPGTALLNNTPIVASVTGNRFLGVDDIVQGAATESGNQTAGFPTFAPPPGAVLALDDAALRAYAPAGALTQYAGIAGESGLALLDGAIFVASRTQGVGRLDPTAGISTFFFGPQGIEALGSDGDRLLAAVFGANEVLAYSADGELLETIALQAAFDLGIAGLDSDGTHLFVGSYLDGDVYVFDMAGALLQTIDTGLPAEWLSSLAFDPFDGALLVGAGFGDGGLRRFDLAGALLGTSQFARGFGGLATLGTRAAPVPAPAFGLFAAAVLGLAIRARLDGGRRRS
jgi:hypothetical protein